MQFSLTIGNRTFGFKASLPMRGGRQGFLYGLLPGTQRDWVHLAGNPWENSIVAASLGWIGDNVRQAPSRVYQEGADGKEAVVEHPLAGLLARPNKFYSGDTLRFGMLLSLICAAEAYAWIRKANDGSPSELWYLPHFQVKPISPESATTDTFITGYEYTAGNEKKTLLPEDVWHVRSGLNPVDTRRGLNLLNAAARQIVSENDIANWEAALLSNFCIPGCLIAPKDQLKKWGGGEKQELKNSFETTAGGDNRFRPVVLDGPVDVHPLALKPSEMLLPELHQLLESRLTAMIGVNPMVLGLMVGLEHSTLNNMEETERASWRRGILSKMDLIHSEANLQLLPLYRESKGKTLRVGLDLSRVTVLQDSQDEIYKRNTAAVGGAWLTPNEARASVGLPSIEGGDKLVVKPAPVLPGDKPRDEAKRLLNAWYGEGIRERENGHKELTA